VVDVVRAQRILVVAALFAAAAAGCSKAPSAEEIAARKARDEAILQASQEEERRKDRERHAAAAKAAASEAETIRAPTAPVAEETSQRPTLTMLGQVHPVQTTEEEVVAHATARVEMALANPASMLVRSPQLREQNTIVCLEVNARDAAGSYTGFQPVIVTPRKVLVHKPIAAGRDVGDVSSTLEFNQWNERVKCF
jgi:hypothetical protein